MKKLFLLFTVIFLTCVVATIQAQNPVKVYRYATYTTPLGRTVVAGDWVVVSSTGQILEVTTTFGATATPYSIVTNGHYHAYPAFSGGSATLTPASTGTGSVGTSSLKWGAGYFNAIVNKDSIVPLSTGTGKVGTANRTFDVAYINNVITGTVNATAVSVSGGGYFSYSNKVLMDSAFYFGSRTSGSSVWLPWNVRQAGTPSCRMNLQNMGDYSIQNKAGTGQVLVIQRDTSKTTAKINLPAINTATVASSVTIGSATDTVPLYMWSTGSKKWKVSISPSGVIYAVTVTP